MGKTLFERAISAIGKTIAPVIFDPKKRGNFTFRDPVGKEVAEWAARANVVALQIQTRFNAEATEALKAIVELQDNLTDIAGSVEVSKDVRFLAQAQEILDIPLESIAAAWIKVLKISSDSNESTIMNIRSRRRRK